jgi:hypothetical protein
MLLIAATILAVPMGAYHLSIGLYTQAAMAFMAGGVGVMLLSGWDPAAVWVEQDTEPVEEIALYSLSTPVLIRVAEAQGDCIKVSSVRARPTRTSTTILETRSQRCGLLLR